MNVNHSKIDHHSPDEYSPVNSPKSGTNPPQKELVYLSKLGVLSTSRLVYQSVTTGHIRTQLSPSILAQETLDLSLASTGLAKREWIPMVT